MTARQKLVEAYNSAAFSDAVAHLYGRDQRGPWASSELTPVAEASARSGAAHTIRISSTSDACEQRRTDYFDAFDAVPPGVMLIVEVVDDVGGAVIGDVMASSLQHRGVHGVVVSGPIRDSGPIAALGLATWSRSVTMHSMSSDKVATEAGVTIQCAGVTIRPGDFVVADTDGFIAIPQERAPAVISRVERSLSAEEETMQAIHNGAKLAEVYKP